MNFKQCFAKEIEINQFVFIKLQQFKIGVVGCFASYNHLFEPPHDKTNKMTCAPNEDSDQPGHPPSLIRDFALRMKKAWVL